MDVKVQLCSCTLFSCVCAIIWPNVDVHELNMKSCLHQRKQDHLLPQRRVSQSRCSPSSSLPISLTSSTWLFFSAGKTKRPLMVVNIISLRSLSSRLSFQTHTTHCHNLKEPESMFKCSNEGNSFFYLLLCSVFTWWTCKTNGMSL